MIILHPLDLGHKVDEMVHKYPDFWEYKHEMVALAKKNANLRLNLEALYNLAKSQCTDFRELCHLWGG